MEIKTIGQLVTQLATKAGIDAADVNLVNILSNADLSKVPIHSDLANAIDNNLLSVDQALDNHPRIKPKYTAEALNAFDKQMETAMTEAGLDEAKIAELKGEKNTFKRFQALQTAIKDTIAKATKTEAGTDNSALQKQNDDLLKQLQENKKTYTSELERIQNESAADKKSFRTALEVRALLSGHKTLFDELPADAKQAALDSLIRKGLQDKAAEFDFDETGNGFIIRKTDGSNLVGANHAKYTPQTFIDEILAQNKVLVVSNNGSNGGNNKPSGSTNNNNGGGNAGNNNNNQQKQTQTVTANGDAPKGNNQAVININRARREAATTAEK